MDVPVRKYITRITKTERLDFPASVNTMTVDFLPLLEITWKAKEAMKTAHLIVTDKKRKAPELAIDNSNVVPSLAFSFYH